MGTRYKVITASTSTMRTPGGSVSRVSAVLLLLHTAQGSLTSRIGLRLGAAHHAHHHSALEHKPRQPWAVRNMKAEMLANERSPGSRPSQDRCLAIWTRRRGRLPAWASVTTTS